MEKWMLHTKKGDFRKTAAEYGISPVLARIMVNRGVKEEEQIRKFLNVTIEVFYFIILLLYM